MKRTTYILMTLFMLGLLTACVPVESLPASETASDASSEEAATEGAAAAAEECGEGLRLFDHPRLISEPVCIPENAQNVLPLDLNSMEFMLITGMDFAASSQIAQFFISNTHPEWLDELVTRTEGLPDTGAFPPNMEAAALAQPDLIVTEAGYYEDNMYDLMREIAPTIVYEAQEEAYQDWKPQFRFFGEALGMEAEAKALIAGYQERIDALAETLGDSLDGQTVSVVRARPDGEMGMRLAGSFTGVILGDLGVAQPESQQQAFDPDTGFIQIDLSSERWDLIDGDYLFVYGVQPTEAGTNEAQALIESLADDAIWNTLGAVKTNNAHAMDAHWHGFGLLSAHEVIDDMFRILAGTEPTVENPLLAPGE
ncbi:MAG: iron-siderophore ABC transporter substrate-binding protein [Chloroflexota bacterium]